MDFDQIVAQLRDLPLIKRAFDLLAAKSSAALFYHCIGHSEDVLREAIRFGVEDGLDQHKLELLAIAAAYHDLGFIDAVYENNEIIGARYAEEAMRKVGSYSEDDIQAVRTMILDTEVQFKNETVIQVPTTELSRYLCDADLSNLGREDFFEKSEQRYLELGSPDRNLYRRNLIKFLSSHKWHTPAAERLRTEARDDNLQVLKNWERKQGQGTNS